MGYYVSQPQLFGVVVAIASFLITAIGFTPAGIAAGSVAAAIQSGIGNVAVGSTFATLQSLGATGAIAAAGTIGAGVAAGGHLFHGDVVGVDGTLNNPFAGGGTLDSLKPTKQNKPSHAERKPTL